jgi:hypothetical protein
LKSLPWRRHDLIERIRRDVWRYLTPAASVEQELLEASALLRMPADELRTVGALQFLTSTELKEMLEHLPRLLRRLSTTTTSEEEWSPDRIRGSIQWGRTIGLRYATGMQNVYVTAPTRRAYQTPENALLTFLLSETVTLGRRTGWHQSSTVEIGATITARVNEAERLRQSRMLLGVTPQRITPRQLARIRAGRYRQRYRTVLAAWDRYQDLVRHLDRHAIRHAVETHGVVSRDDPTLFELICTFAVLDTLQTLGWQLSRFGLFAGSLRLVGRKGSDQLDLYYQTTPASLSKGSVYRDVLQQHAIAPGVLRPDLVIRRRRHHELDRWILIEAKGGERPVEQSARAATYDLLAYRTAFERVLSAATEGPYGLGVAWGYGLYPTLHDEIALCSPDTLDDALAMLLT